MNKPAEGFTSKTQKILPQFANSRHIASRLIVEGALKLQTPARFGGGKSDDLLDMPVLMDAIQKRALLTGASIAGAMRSYLRTKELGDSQPETPSSLCVILFGRSQGKDEGAHSVLMMHDALSSHVLPQMELRDGVAIDGRSRTAEDGKKFDIELLAAGAEFKLRFELFLPENKEEQNAFLRALAIALEGFEKGQISLGARKRRGFGKCQLDGDWTVIRYDVSKHPADLIAWLKSDRSGAKRGAQIAQLLGVSSAVDDVEAGKRFILKATFALDGSLIIRSGNGDVNAADSVSLRSKRGKRDVAVVSGSSIAGALRARAARIANTLQPNKLENNWAFVEGIFGVRYTKRDEKSGGKDKRPLKASRLIVHEAEIKNAVEPEMVQTRVKIDRFTGGAYPTGLFSEQPVFSSGLTEIEFHLELLNPKEEEMGLLLLLLKDLWTGDLPLGGESSVGRGRLKGKSATLCFGKEIWKLDAAEDLIITGDAQRLEHFVNKFNAEIKK